MKRVLRITAWAGALYLAAMALLAWDGSRERLGSADVILVLGSGGVNADGTLTLRERARLDRALLAAAEQPRAVVLASGASEIHGQSEAAGMASYLAAHGLPLARIVPDPAGATTWDSARNTAAFLRDRDLRGVVVVTEYFHLSRVRLALGRFGVAPVFSAPAFCVRWGDFRAVAREVGGWAAYRFRPLP
ncbi:Uncharacterized SAM-binding protein YcdF, DUF218 family [Verrucomicrobium sp. GAS474]|uniref:YdcF family protein n=1 Tax=Verrucomicrobium sp. GAS474 TaxID=1882831 RepID=UPI00087BBFCF|nr:YdcF family protein [Verrucomicrobium sp. GAS474]SDT91976.1 Uncharacterized SAM-binding protein YcdF, DUF218 family [Verrucomicrobium sp. GAS474]